MFEFNPDWIARLIAIIIADLLLAGDNAVVIALAARKLPQHLQKKAIWAGTAGAILIRVCLVFFALQLLQIPGLSLVGGLLLLYVAWKLAMGDDGKKKDSSVTVNSFWEAMKVIIIADTVMGLDNILAIAGASGGDMFLVIFGFLLSIPIMVGGSMLILKCIEKAPWIVIAGAALLVGISSRMILDDNWLNQYLETIISLNATGEWIVILSASLIFSLSAFFIKNRKNGDKTTN